MVLLSSAVVPVVFNVDLRRCRSELFTNQNLADPVLYASGVDICMVVTLLVRSVESVE